MSINTIENAAHSSAQEPSVSSLTQVSEPAETTDSLDSSKENKSTPLTSSFGAAFERALDGGNSSKKPIDIPAAANAINPVKETEKTPIDKKAEDTTGILGDLPKLDTKDTSKNYDGKTSKLEVKPATSLDESTSDKDLEEELNNPHKKEKSQRRYRQLWENWKKAEEIVATTKKSISDKESKLEELEKQIKSAAESSGLTPEVKTQLDELAMFKREKGLKDDPRVKELFDNRTSSAETFIMDLLTKRESPLPENYVQAIVESGGFIGFSESYPEAAEQIFEILPLVEKKQIESAMAEQMILSRQKNAYIENEKANAVKYFEDKAKSDASELASRPDPRKEVEAVQKQFSVWKENVKKEAKDVFGEIEIPLDASSDIRNELTEKNKFARQLSNALDKRVTSNTPSEWQDVILESVLAHKFSADNKVLRSRVSALESELESVRGAGRTIARSTGIVTPNATKTDNKFKSFAELMANRVESTD